jgi:DNA-binding transcriptional ArsR family regulator
MPALDPRARAIAALRFRALGDETRLRILEELIPGEQCVADLMERTGLGQSLVSHHLRTLRDAGLVTDRRDGRWSYYSIVDPVLIATRRAVQLFEMMPEPDELTE